VPAKARDISRALKKLGVELIEPNKGSHWKAVKGGIVYPIPCHNGPKTEISDVYIRGVCRAFGLNEAEFRKAL